MASMVVPESLRSYLHSVVGYHEVMAPQAVHHGLPSPYLTVVLAFDQPLDCGWMRGREDRARYWTCAAGLHTAPALIRTHGFQYGIQLSLTPRGARALLGLPASALAGAMTTSEDLPYGVGPDLHARLAEAPDWPTRWQVLTEAFTTRFLGDTGARPEVDRAWQLLMRSDGRARVSEIADHVGWGRRRLLREFRAEYGVGPKEAAMTMRFDRAVRSVRAGGSLAEVAAGCGYADQTHMTRDFTVLGGGTPLGLREPWIA